MCAETLDGSKRPIALKDWAHERIKEEILNLRIPPGAMIPINDMADKLNISRTPIREALLRLESEGLVRVEPRVGFFATQVTKRDLEHVFELRILLESYAAEKATPLLTGGDLDHIQSLFEGCVLAIETGQMDEFLRTDIAFHALLNERSANPRLVAMLGLTEDLTFRERVLGLQSPENVRKSQEEHWLILKALQQRDAALVRRLMHEHLCAVRDRLLDFPDLPQGDS
jgi:DNA-binding GntR family transcriptional regulator